VVVSASVVFSVSLPAVPFDLRMASAAAGINALRFEFLRYASEPEANALHLASLFQSALAAARAAAAELPGSGSKNAFSEPPGSASFKRIALQRPGDCQAAARVLPGPLLELG
jgi:hypothetical protein